MTVNDIYVRKVFSEEVVAASSTVDSEIIDIGALVNNGSFALQIYCTCAAASVNATCVQSNNGVNFIVGNGVATIIDGYPTVSTVGYEIYTFTPVLARFMKIRLLETAAAEATVTAWLSIG